MEDIPGQTILVQKPRDLPNNGHGFQENNGVGNISQELAFTLQLSACFEQDQAEFVTYNLKSKLPLKKTYALVPPEFECLTKRRGYD